MSSIVLLWVLFWAVFVIVSAIDLFFVTRRRETIPVRTALRWTALWISVAMLYSVAIWLLHPQGKQVATLFIAGYLTEYSLSVDNLFVFILIFSLMGVPEVAQPKLIKLGIYLSIVLRIVFIIFGIALIHRFHWLIYLFGALLLWTAWKMVATDEADQVHPDKNILYRLAARFLPIHADAPESRRLFLRDQGRLYITPLFLVFLVIGSTDVLFAIDSIPAIVGISQDPFVVLTSNVFAVLGLNSLFFALRGVMSLFRFLKHGVSIILFFIGAKMIAGAYPPIDDWFKDHPYVSLGVITIVLVVSIVLSLWHQKTCQGQIIDAPTKKPGFAPPDSCP
ncbi:MAG: TerC/Alx family metal homeostasis membrane protein [Opitutaceae bacterium]|nr:TerC/Alx family metal homeostasis membrane protein [Opitutaceae bacterium]